jgi:hypothetical protein
VATNKAVGKKELERRLKTAIDSLVLVEAHHARESEQAAKFYRKEAISRIENVSRVANSLIFDLAKQLADAEVAMGMFRDILDQVSGGDLYAREVKLWLEKFDQQGSFDGSSEELAEYLGLGSLKRDYSLIYKPIEAMIMDYLNEYGLARSVGLVTVNNLGNDNAEGS